MKLIKTVCNNKFHKAKYLKVTVKVINNNYYKLINKQKIRCLIKYWMNNNKNQINLMMRLKECY